MRRKYVLAVAMAGCVVGGIAAWLLLTRSREEVIRHPDEFYKKVRFVDEPAEYPTFTHATDPVMAYETEYVQVKFKKPIDVPVEDDSSEEGPLRYRIELPRPSSGAVY